MFAAEQVAGLFERCQQGGDCPNLATYWSDGGHLMCAACAGHWFEADAATWEDDPQWLAADLAAGLARPCEGGGYEYRIPAKRLDAPGVPRDYARTAAAVDALLIVQASTVLGGRAVT